MEATDKLQELALQIVRLEEKLRAAEKALDLAQSNTHVVVAEVLSVLAILSSVYAIIHK